MAVAMAGLVSLCLSAAPALRAQSVERASPPAVRLADDAGGIAGIVRALINAFDQVDVVALGETHGLQIESDLRLALVRHPDFARKVRAIVVEFASTTEQTTLDRYIRGENLPKIQLEQVWKATSQSGPMVEEYPFYTDFFAAVREVNLRLPADARIRVFGGDPGKTNPDREATAIAILKEQILRRQGKALVIYGAAHFYRAGSNDAVSRLGDVGIVRTLEVDYPGRTLAVIPVGGKIDLPPGVNVPT